MISAQRQFLILILITASIRAAISWIGLPDLAGDPDSYARLATTWATTGTLGFEGEAGVSPTAFRPPLYPWLLSWFVVDQRVSPIAVAVLHVLLGCATVALTYAIGCKLRLRWAWVAGLAVAIDPILLRQSQLVMTETLATFLAVVVWWLGLVAWPDAIEESASGRPPSRFQWSAVWAFGLALGIAVLARPTAVPWALLCTVAAFKLGSHNAHDPKRGLKNFACVCLGIAVCVLPWSLRNWAVLGKPIWATTHGGYTLLLANNPPLYRHFIEHGPSRNWEAENFQESWSVRLALENRPPNELLDDELGYQAARSTIARQPQVFLLSCFYRVGWLWALWPFDGTFGPSEVVIAAWYAVMYLLALASLRFILKSQTYQPWLIGLLLVFSLTAVHAVYWSNMRMRAPAMPCVILLAAAWAGTGNPKSTVRIKF